LSDVVVPELGVNGAPGVDADGAPGVSANGASGTGCGPGVIVDGVRIRATAVGEEGATVVDGGSDAGVTVCPVEAVPVSLNVNDVSPSTPSSL